MFAWVLNMPLLLEDSSNVLVFKVVYIIKTVIHDHFLSFFKSRFFKRNLKDDCVN